MYKSLDRIYRHKRNWYAYGMHWLDVDTILITFSCLQTSSNFTVNKVQFLPSIITGEGDFFNDILRSDSVLGILHTVQNTR